MSGRAIWDRLLWKEFSQGWLVLLAASVAPAVLFPVSAIQGHVDPAPELADFGPAAAVIAVLAAHLPLIFWGAGKGEGRRNSDDFTSRHLPVSPLLEWTTSFLMPTAAVACVGLWFGYWARWTSASVLGLPLSLAGAIDLTTTFALSYFISAAVSRWAGIVLGAVRAMGALLIPISAELAADQTGYTGVRPEVTGMILRLLIGSLLGSLLIAIPFRRLNVSQRQAAGLFVLIAVALGPLIMRAGEEIRSSEVLFGKPEYYSFSPGLAAPPGSPVQAAVDDLGRMVFFDDRNGSEVKKKLNGNVQLAGLVHNRVVYYAVETPGKAGAAIYRWDTRRRRSALLARVPVGRQPLTDESALHGVSPDEHWMLITFRSLIGRGCDLWLVDLRTGRSHVVAANAPVSAGEYVVWPRGRAIVSGGSVPLVIDLHDKTCRRLDPLAREMNRP